MDEVIKRSLLKTNPELESGNHLPRWGLVTRIPAPLTDGQLSAAMDTGYAVDVQMLTETGDPDGTPYESVPLPSHMIGNNRGVYGFPQPGTRVLVQFVYGSPEHPVITGIYPLDRHMPALGNEETLIQHSPATFLRSTQDEDWRLQARNKVWIGNAMVNLVAEVRRLSEWARDHKHPANMKEAVTKAAAGAIARKVQSIEK